MNRFAILAISALVGTSDAWSLFSTSFDTQQIFPPTQSCSQNTDCHMCSLSSCKWTGNSCTGTPAEVTFDWWRQNAGQCQDNLDICDKKSYYARKCQTANCEKAGFADYDKEIVSYKREKEGTLIPRGYYCYNRVEVNKEFVPLMFWNRTDNWAQRKENHENGANVAHDQLMYISQYYRSTNNKHSSDRFDDKDDIALYNQKHDNKFSLLFGQSEVYYMDMGWINTRQTKLDSHQEQFQMVVLKTHGYWEYMGIYKQAYPVAYFFMMLFLCVCGTIFATICCTVIFALTIKPMIEKYRADNEVTNEEPLIDNEQNQEANHLN